MAYKRWLSISVEDRVNVTRIISVRCQYFSLILATTIVEAYNHRLFASSCLQPIFVNDRGEKVGGKMGANAMNRAAAGAHLPTQ